VYPTNIVKKEEIAAKERKINNKKVPILACICIFFPPIAPVLNFPSLASPYASSFL
jgi:hypothetical protein